MAYKLGVLIVHGIGSQELNFADPLIADLKGRLGAKAAGVFWRPVHWAPVTESGEARLWNDLKRGGDLDFSSLRQFLIRSFGDAIAYQRVASAHNHVYKSVHDVVHHAIKSLRAAAGRDVPIVALAHSLGCAILSNYIWDRQHAGAGDALEPLDTLTGLVTFGCNIPLFTLAYEKIESIAFPDPALPAPLRPKARWLNFYDRDDVLGFPLKTLSPDYGRAVTEDIEINVGGPVSFWNPMSHDDYWEDADFTGPVARLLETFL